MIDYALDDRVTRWLMAESPPATSEPRLHPRPGAAARRRYRPTFGTESDHTGRERDFILLVPDLVDERGPVRDHRTVPRICWISCRCEALSQAVNDLDSNMSGRPGRIPGPKSSRQQVWTVLAGPERPGGGDRRCHIPR